MKMESAFRLTEENSPLCVFEEASWGRWRFLVESNRYKVRLIEIYPGRRTNLEIHRQRSERWVVLSGRASITVAGQSGELTTMQGTVIPAGAVHRIGNSWSKPLIFIEFQHGPDLSDDDVICMSADAY